MATTSKNSKTAYRDNPKLRRDGVKIEYTQEQLEEYGKCAKDPIYFAEKYIKIINVDEGLIPFKMWDFQKKLISNYKDNRFCITKLPRQVGKTTTTVAYLLWLSLFHNEQTIAILANKGSLARDILAKYQLAYENLPEFLQQGIIVWNKGSVELENNSKVVAASTSSSAIRGGTFNCVVLDEFAFVPNNMAQDFFNSVYPVISSGKTTKILIISTPNGMNLFYKIWADAQHKKNDYVPLEINWWDVPGRDEKWKEETIRNTSLRQFQQEFECQFLGSSNTLVDGQKLQTMFYKDPIERMKIGNDNFLDIYEQPIKGDDELTKDHIYVATVDVAEGKGLDASTVHVMDVSTTPYKQVAKYSNSFISPVLFPTVIHTIAKYYNEAFVLVEINNNPQIADILINEMEYENVLRVETGNKQAQTLSTGFGRGVQSGLKMSVQTKRIGCLNLKTLIESDKLFIQDFDTVSELTTFIASGNSWEAEEGANDDNVMALVIFGWMSTQKYFRDIVDHDLRKQLQLEKFNRIEEHNIADPLMDNGLDIPFVVEDGDIWFTGDYEEGWKSHFNNF